VGAVEEWLGSLQAESRALLRPYVERAKALVPDAEEGVSYAMPALLYRGRGLVALAVTKGGYSVYPFSGVVVGSLMAEHPGWDHTKGAIHFTAERPLPGELFDELVRRAKGDVDRRLNRRR